MTVILDRNPNRLGCTDEWTARITDGPGLTRSGIGRSRIEALGSMLGANLDLFGITRRIDRDPLSTTPECEWTKTIE